MELQKKLHWYQNLNGLIIFLGILFPAAYALITYALPQQADNDLLQISYLAAGIAAVALLYGLFIYPKLHNQRPQQAITIGFLLIAAATAVQLHYSGGVTSPYLIVWALLIIASGIVGWHLVLLMAVVTNAYWALIALDIVEYDISSNRQILYMIATTLPIMVAFLIWMYSRASQHIQSVSGLSSDLSIEQNKSQFVLQAIEDAVIVLNEKGNIDYINPSASTMSGWQAKDAAGLSYTSMLNLQPILASEGFQDPIEKVYQSGKPIVADDFKLITQSGQEVMVGVSVSPLKESSTSEGAVVVMRDIGKQKAAEDRKNDFIATASHEMRTPIAQIKGYLELLANPNVIKLEPKALDYVNKSYKSADHLGNLFKDLLASSQGEDGKIQNRPDAVDMTALLREIVQGHDKKAQEKGIQLSFRQVSGPSDIKVISPNIYAYVDPERIRELTDNLIENSLKYTKEGSIDVTLGANKDILQIDIKDTGMGISVENSKHLFEKFYRVDSTDTREISGTGLGLYICKQIVDLYRGKLWVDSILGEGSTFHIQLPKLANTTALEMINRKKVV